MPPSITFLFWSLSLANCVAGYKYDGDSFISASLAITCIYAFIFIILIVLCAITLGIAQGHRRPYICLLISLVFSFISVIAQIVQIVVSSNGERGATLPGNTAVAMSSMEEFFGAWALPFLFLSFCLLLKLRFHVNGPSGGHSGRLNPAWTIAYTTISALLLIFGATLTGLYTNYNRAFLLPSGRIGITLGKLNSLAIVNNDVTYTFDAIWYSSAFVVGGLAIHTYKAMNRAGVFDKVTKTLVYVAFPLYVCYMIQSIIFTILFSPSGLKQDVFNQNQRNNASMATLVIEYGFYSTIAFVLIICGMRRSNWAANGQTPQKGWDDAYPLPS